jgi:phosphoheptose isomerase
MLVCGGGVCAGDSVMHINAKEWLSLCPSQKARHNYPAFGRSADNTTRAAVGNDMQSTSTKPSLCSFEVQEG